MLSDSFNVIFNYFCPNQVIREIEIKVQIVLFTNINN